MVLRPITSLPPPSSPPPHHPHPQILPVPNPTPSYWLSQPSKHASLRSTPTLPTTCDIAIIGSGMAGVLTAYHILQQQTQTQTQSQTRPPHQHQKPPSILLLEARTLCSGATGRNGGHIKCKTLTLTGLHDTKDRNAMQTFVLNVIDQVKRVVEELGVECEFELGRSFDVYLDEEEGQHVKALFEAAVRKGEEWTRRITCLHGDGIAEKITSVQGAKVAFSVPAASLWPYKFVTGVLDRLLERYGQSINVQTTTPVVNVTTVDDDEEHGSSVLLDTPRGSIRAGKLVLATNAYTAGLVPDFLNTIVPYKGMASHHSPREPVFPHLNQTYNIHFAPNERGKTGADYLNPRPDGGIVVGGGGWMFRDDVRSWLRNFDDSRLFPKNVMAYWDDYMQSNFRGWENSGAQVDGTWVGIQGLTPDGLPHVGRVVGTRKQWVLAGFNGGGMSFIPVVAKAVAKMVSEDVGFEDVEEEFGLLAGMGTSEGRLIKGVGF
ncbi:hypothetical protein NX059_001485 [Plenodomus lindquistii]|nr:hypothetical protein NX059_001485 [Plenodomus lindquistii]